MPRRASVASLQKLCMGTFSRYLLKFVQIIAREYEWYGNLKSQIYTQLIQEDVLTQISCALIDELFAFIKVPDDFDDNEKLILLSIFMSPSMKRFVPKFKLPPHDDFYLKHVPRLSKIVVLDLTMTCTDEILEVVGKSCPLVEEISVVSKIESVTGKIKPLNALKLKFFVSDEGLDHLHKCQKLRIIIMNYVPRINCGGRKITHEGIRRLLSALPNLQYISYSDIGTVLDEQPSLGTLNIEKLHDNHIHPKHIDVFDKTCPKLKVLCLRVPMTDYDQSMPGLCLSRLAVSDLQIKSLQLSYFPFDHFMKDYLIMKGAFLLSFSLSCIGVNAKTLYTLGLNCPNLKYLELKVLHSEEGEHIILQRKKPLFSCLETLRLIGYNWDPHVVFPLCLHNAKSIRRIGLINRDHLAPVDDLINDLIRVNPLSQLREVCFHESFPMKTETFVNFVLKCPNLTSIVVAERDSNLYCIIQNLIVANNYDLRIRLENCCSGSCSMGCHQSCLWSFPHFLSS